MEKEQEMGWKNIGHRIQKAMTASMFYFLGLSVNTKCLIYYWIHFLKPFKVSGNDPTDIQQMKKHFRKSAKIKHNSNLCHLKHNPFLSPCFFGQCDRNYNPGKEHRDPFCSISPSRATLSSKEGQNTHISHCTPNYLLHSYVPSKCHQKFVGSLLPPSPHVWKETLHLCMYDSKNTGTIAPAHP